MPKAQKIALYNNKGGVAKTTSIINLAYSIQKQGCKVLVVDCDSQENCFSFFLDNAGADAILPTAYENINHTTWTRYVVLDDERIAGYDYILFDLPPALTDEVKAIIHHCGTVYVPTVLGEFEIAGLEKVADAINRENARLGGIFVTMYNKENDAELIEEFRQMLQDRVMATVIPYSKTVRESQKAGMPPEAYFIEKKVPRSSWKIVNAYTALAAEMIGG